MTDFAGAARRAVLQPLKDATAGAFPGGSVTIRLRSEDTVGQLGLVEQVVAPGDQGPPMHIHPAFDETFYVLEGTLAFRLGDHTRDAGSGSVAFVPRGTAPSANPGEQTARILVLVTPFAFERYFEELIASINAGGAVPAADELAALRIAHGSIPA